MRLGTMIGFSAQPHDFGTINHVSQTPWLFIGCDSRCCCGLLANCAGCHGTHAAGDTLVVLVNTDFGRRACASADGTVPVGLEVMQVVDLLLFSDAC